MTVINVEKDPGNLSLTITADLNAPVNRAWELWDDPRQLERWWGPPTYPATFVEHDLTPGAIVTYFMTGPEDDRPRGWWRVLTVEAPTLLVFEDGFSDEQGSPDPDMPVMTIRVELHSQPEGGSRMTVETTFASAADMERILAMGMDEGMSAAMGQIDEILKAGSPTAS